MGSQVDQSWPQIDGRTQVHSQNPWAHPQEEQQQELTNAAKAGSQERHEQLKHVTTDAKNKIGEHE